MAAVGRTPTTRSAMLNYIPPEGASEANVSRARALCRLRKNRWRPEERQQHAEEETLYDLSKQHDPDGRRWKAHNVLRNQEFLIALILVGEQRRDAVPPEWLEPMDNLCNSRKRSRASAFDQQPVQSVVYKLDIMNPNRYFCIAYPAARDDMARGC